MSDFCAKQSKILRCVIILLICLFCATALCACNDGKYNKKIKESERALYLGRIVYNTDLTMTVNVSLKGDEAQKLNSKLTWISTTYNVNVLFKREDVDIIVNSSELYNEINGRLTEDVRIHEGVEYSGLKLVLNYDTIYKSISSNARISKISGRYYHYFDLDESLDGQQFWLSAKTQISANWYTILIASVLALAVVAVAVALAIRGKLWQMKKK